MTVALLLALAALTGWLAPAGLSRLPGLARLPRVAVAVWMAVIVGMSAAVVGASVAATLPLVHDVGGLQEFVHRCPQWLAAVLAHRSALLLAAVGAILTVTLLTSAAWSLTCQLRQLREDGRQHLGVLIAARQAQNKLAVVPDARPAAWSLAAGKGHVVVTSAAVDALTTEELAAVVAHEYAHLRGRHHLLVALIRAAQQALPCALTRTAALQVSELLEMRADDVAVARSGRAAVAGALLRLSAAAPAGTLGAGGGQTALRRMQRLIDPPSPPAARGAVAAAGALMVVVVPVTITTLAAATVVSLHFCPLS